MEAAHVPPRVRVLILIIALTAFAESHADELDDAPPRIKAVPRFYRGSAIDRAGERTVILAWIANEFDRNAGLPESTVHLLGLSEWIRSVGVTLQQQKRRLGVRYPG